MESYDRGRGDLGIFPFAQKSGSFPVGQPFDALSMDDTMDEPEAHIARELSWAELLRLAQDGDRAAYGRLLREVTPLLRRMSQRHHRDSRDVEDCVQDILMTIHQVRHTYDPTRPFTPWLMAIGRRRIIDRLRTVTRSRRRETELTIEHETFSAAEPNSEVDESEIRALRALVDTLPDRQKEAVRLLKFEEKSLKEAAAASGQTIGALKLAMHRALKTMRARMRVKDDGSVRH